MKKKIIGIIVCMLLIAIPILSTAETIMDDITIKDLTNDNNFLKQRTVCSKIRRIVILKFLTP